MKLNFFKYQGAGNDFIIVDDRTGVLQERTLGAFVKRVCERRFGIGADGFIAFRQNKRAQPQMVYYNADGAPSSFCGNGSRCFLHFLHDLGLAQLGEEIIFEANDGMHQGKMFTEGYFKVSMLVSAKPSRLNPDVHVVETGSPHYVQWCDSLPEGDITSRARKVRNSPQFADEGINVNYVAYAQSEGLAIRTYERGVEDETLACGTGVTAAAISFAERHEKVGQQIVSVKALGGVLAVSLVRSVAGEISEVVLHGPSRFVFSGEIELN